MPMMPEHFPNFYMGAAAESMFAGEMYLLGYEAAKFSPDFGIDFSITNAARQKFYDETAKLAQVQVKSTFAYNGIAKIFIGCDDFHFICNSPERFLVCYIFYDFFKPVDADSANYRADPVELACQKDIAEYESRLMESEGAEIKRDDPRVIFEFRYRKRTAFWLNGDQLKKGLQANDWQKSGQDKFVGRIIVGDATISLNGNILFPELLDLNNIMYETSSKNSFQSGKYSHEHI